MVEENTDEIVGFGREPKKKKSYQQSLEDYGAIKKKIKQPTKQQLEDQEFGPTERMPSVSKRRPFLSDDRSSSLLETAKVVKDTGMKAGRAIKTKAKATAEKYIEEPIKERVELWKERPWDISTTTTKKAIGKGVVTGLKALTGNVEENGNFL